ncbi:iron-containing alcohol dehydrogenase family protein [Desulfitobacterium sp. THU1]|uniref:iron-containing alcohol dehydrogenase family protein n=1 Tax=Desulfitobacterium sp. THU1 TaxID=3138072 RepID=UPI00311DEBA0
MNTFYMPTKILSGENVVLEKAQELAVLGQKAMIITGRASSRLNGSLRDMEEALSRIYIDYVIFDEVEQNPSLETMMRAAELGKKEDVDFLVGVGGGSPLDAAKFVGVLMKNPELSGPEVFERKNLQSIPIVAVPTTSGTGSEVTQYAVITLHEEKTKKNYGQTIFPTLAFHDPKYTLDLPLSVTINTAVDALSHLVEGYLNRNANLLSDTIAEMGMRIWGQCVDPLLTAKLDGQVREKLMVASTLGGILIAQTGTSLPHGMGYALTFNKGVPHGLANGVIYVEYLRSFKNKAKVSKLPELLGIKDYESFEEVLGRLTIVDSITVTDEEIRDYSLGVFENKAKLANHPEEVTYEDIYKIYRDSLR